MEWIDAFFQVTWSLLFHLDETLLHWMQLMGPGLILILCLIVFCETGLVVTPFLPGDSLLFMVGTLAAVNPDVLPPLLTGGALIAAGILGDAVNYSMGAIFGPRVFRSANSRFLNRAHLERTQTFYDRHGGKTIVLARFMPIVRTLAPFVAGMGRMNYSKFAFYNILGAVLWVVIFMGAGYLFGNLPAVKKNLTLVLGIVILVSVLPLVWEWFQSRRKAEPC